MRYASMHQTTPFGPDNLAFPFAALIPVVTSIFSASKQRKAKKAAQRAAAAEEARQLQLARAERVSVRAAYPKWTTPALLIGGAVAVGAVVYFATRRRRRR